MLELELKAVVVEEVEREMTLELELEEAVVEEAEGDIESVEAFATDSRASRHNTVALCSSSFQGFDSSIVGEALVWGLGQMTEAAWEIRLAVESIRDIKIFSFCF